ncbi:sulfurtransferase [Winogradskyella sp. UBA3174]|uniref:sulfurtransferase n=1 Tax=Winogradskyella sp. UBA3174 TaxID=1947785 RepID=UPI0025E4F659|nr:sulfurtransferase [Winogradskyella sp. UBA3174]|tara:strand:- start:24768 stop:25583 length:816 start_codon:yes stop_codon:yes gene_type:complete
MNPTHINSSLVSVKWLNANLNTTSLIVLDATINKAISNTAERIPNARFFDIKKKFSTISAPFPSTLPTAEQFQEEARLLGINEDSAVIVYDDKGIYSSARAWWLFKTFGFKNIAVLDGGIPEWLNNNFEVEHYKDETYPIGNFEAKLNLELMTDFNGINTFSNKPDSLIIDARSEVRFKCLVDEPKAGLRRGTIPNSENLPYTELLNGNKLKSKTELSEIFNNLVEDKTELVFSCGSGITACILALAATLCNYNNLTVYDGSWTEYGSLTK